MTMTRIDRGSTETTTIYSEGGDLVFERTFDAPRDRVWRAFTDPELVPRWWGPHGTTTTVVEMDVRPGGTWRYVSSAPDRDDVVFYGEYLAVDPPEGFEWTFMFDVEGVGPQGGPESHTFEDLGGRTRVRSVGHLGSRGGHRRLAGDRHGQGRDRDLGSPRDAARRGLTSRETPGIPTGARRRRAWIPSLVAATTTERAPGRRGRHPPRRAARQPRHRSGTAGGSPGRRSPR